MPSHFDREVAESYVGPVKSISEETARLLDLTLNLQELNGRINLKEGSFGLQRNQGGSALNSC